jgi:hypothetical protein
VVKPVEPAKLVVEVETNPNKRFAGNPNWQ